MTLLSAIIAFATIIAVGAAGGQWAAALAAVGLALCVVAVAMVDSKPSDKR